MHRSEKYLQFIRDKPCCVCSLPEPSDPHHWGPMGWGLRTHDCLTVPVCRPCHDKYHGFKDMPGLKRHRIENLFLRRQTQYMTEWIQQLENS